MSDGIPLVGVLDLVRIDAIAVAGRLALRPVSLGFELALRRASTDAPDRQVVRVIHVLGLTREFRRVGVAGRLSAESVSDEDPLVRR